MADEPKRADFDLDAWIDGTTGITRAARILQRGDLLARRDQLEAELEAAKKVPARDRGVDDRTPQQIEADIEDCYEQIWGSMLWVHVQDRTNARRSKLVEDLREQGIEDPMTIGYHLWADAIVKVEAADGREVPLGPDGFGAERLRRIVAAAGDTAVAELSRAYQEVTSQAPTVRAPLSRGSSATSGGSTSQSRSGRRGRGGSRR